MAVGKQRPQIELIDIIRYLATKEDVANLRTEIAEVKTSVAQLETKLIEKYNLNTIVSTTVTTLFMIAGFIIHYFVTRP